MKQTLAAYQQSFADLLQLAAQTRESFQGLSRNVVYKQRFQELRTRSLVLLDELYSTDHYLYRDVERLAADKPSFKHIDTITTVLRSALGELEQYEQPSVLADDYRQFEVGETLRKGNQALAAIMAGQMLEQRLEQLCVAHQIQIPGAPGRVGAEQWNMALLRQGLYNRARQQQVTGWLSLRNSAAHNKLTGYGLVEVEKMVEGIFDFLVVFPLPAPTEPPAPETPLVAEPWPTPSPEAQAKTLKNMRKRLRQVKEILVAENITDAKKLKKIRFVVNLLLPDKEQPNTEKAPV